MDVAAIMQSTDRALDALGPLLIRCALLLLSLRFLLGESLVLRPLLTMVERMQGTPALADHPLIKWSGLKVVPAGLLIGTLLGLVVLDRVIVAFGDLLPGRISLMQPELLVRAVPQVRLAELWSVNPAAKDLFDLHQQIDFQVANMAPLANPQVALPWARHAAEAAAAGRAFEAAKCFAVIWLVICIYRSRLALPALATWIRCGVLILLASAVGVWAVQEHVRERREAEKAKVAYLLAAKLTKEPAAALVIADASRQTLYGEKVAAFAAKSPRKPYKLRW